MDIAVVGAGLAGLSCAKSLQLQGHRVMVYEAGPDVGGRMGVCATAVGDFDHGTQYFTIRTDAFATVAAAWRRAGWITQWRARLVAISRGEVRDAGDTRQRFVALPGMNGLCRELSDGLDVRLGQAVQAIEPFRDQWLLRIALPELPLAASAGPFDAVVLAVPVCEALRLARGHADAVSSRASAVSFAPCWTLMMDFDRPLGLSWQGGWVKDSAMGWLANDASRPGRHAGERWVAHATPEWSAAHAGAEAAAVKSALLAAFHDATGLSVLPLFTESFCWPCARIVEPVPGYCVWDERARVGVCGDWFACGLEGGGKVENAWLSGTSLAASMG